MNIKKSYYISDKVVNAAIAIISILLIFYTGYRAATLSFTIDESISFNMFVPQGFQDIISYRYSSSNNHMINTLCMKFISIVFGSSEFLLRLPSVISHLAYIIFSYLIIKRISSPIIVLAGFILLNFNPYLLDFFSLARGYAMAVSFTVICVYFLINYIEKNTLKNLIWSLISAFFAVLSNFSLLIFFLSVIIVINIYWILNRTNNKLNYLVRKNIPVIIATLLLAVIIFEPIRYLIKYQEFYYGGKNGFWQDTVVSLVNTTLYNQPYSQFASKYINYFIAISIIALLIGIIQNYYLRKKHIFSEKYSIALSLLLIPCFISIAQHSLIMTNFLTDRMALFFVPLFFISIIFFFDNYIDLIKSKILVVSVIIIMAVILSAHTIYSLNFSHTLNWKFDAETKKMLVDIENQKNNNNKNTVKLGAIWLYEPTIKFYKKTRKYSWLEEINRDSFKTSYCDYYYLADSNITYINNTNKQILKRYNISNSILATW